MEKHIGIVVMGAVFVDIKGYPLTQYYPGGRNAGRVIQVHGGVSRNIAEDIANVELEPTFLSVVDRSGISTDVIEKLTWALAIAMVVFSIASVYTIPAAGSDASVMESAAVQQQTTAPTNLPGIPATDAQEAPAAPAETPAAPAETPAN